MTFIHYVYAHHKEDTNDIFYIGKGLNRRCYSRHSRNKHWHNVVNKHGFYVKIIARFEIEIDALSFEKQLIALYGRKDKSMGPLVNWTDGGEGSCGRIATDNFKKRMSKVHSFKTLSLSHKEKFCAFGRKQSKETKEKHRLGNLGKKRSEYTKKLQSEIASNRSEEHNKKFGANQRNKTYEELYGKDKAQDLKNKISGINHPKYNHIIYHWVKKDGTVIHCTRYDFCCLYDLNRTSVRALTLGIIKKHKNWSLFNQTAYSFNNCKKELCI